MTETRRCGQRCGTFICCPSLKTVTINGRKDLICSIDKRPVSIYHICHRVAELTAKEN